MHQQPRYRGRQHRDAQDAGQDEAPGIRQMQADMKLDEELPQRGCCIGCEHVQTEAFAACDDTVVGRHLVQHALLPDLAIDFHVAMEKEGEVAGAGATDREIVAIFFRRIRRQPADQAFKRPREWVARAERAGRPQLDLLREHRGRAGHDHGVKQQTEDDAQPAVDGHHQFGFPLRKSDHRLVPCAVDAAGGVAK